MTDRPRSARARTRLTKPNAPRTSLAAKWQSTVKDREEVLKEQLALIELKMGLLLWKLLAPMTPDDLRSLASQSGVRPSTMLRLARGEKIAGPDLSIQIMAAFAGQSPDELAAGSAAPGVAKGHKRRAAGKRSQKQ